LIEAEQIRRIVLVLQLLQPFIVDAIGSFDPFFALVSQIVDVYAS
jgi:hypothetical protein